MAQAKKKKATKSAKKSSCSAKASSVCCGRCSKSTKKLQCDNRERNHIYIITAMGLIAAILLCANAAMLTI